MDAITNPYTPGAGTPPRELAGRNDLRNKVRVCLERLRIGNPAKSVIMVGLRGVGKTVLLDKMRLDAESSGTPFPFVSDSDFEGRTFDGIGPPEVVARMKISD